MPFESGSTLSAALAPATKTCFVGRQPILDRHQAIVGYELLYRAGPDARTAEMSSGKRATASVLVDGVLGIGIEELAEGHAAFVNLSREYLFGELPLPFLPQEVVLEIPEDIDLDAGAIEALAALRREGFKLALDDVYRWSPRVERALPVVNYVKVDTLSARHSELAFMIASFRRFQVIPIATRIESWDCFKRCEELGFQLFQGYYFERPQTITGKTLGSSRLAMLRTLALLQDVDADFARVEEIIAADPGLGTKLLRMANSSLYGCKRGVDSLRQAIVLLGRETVRDWVTLILLHDGLDKPRALTTLALVRAKLCQLLALHSGSPHLERQAFTVGLFSVLDALMDAPMDDIVAKLGLPESVCAALLRQEGTTGALLKIAIRQQRGDVLGHVLPHDLVESSWLESVRWASTVISQLSPQAG